jgi:DNA-binding CsgD family transcriptional regulator
MNKFIESFNRITSLYDFSKMLRYCAPLYDIFGVNYFWYFRVTHSGDYSYIGTHADWSEWSFEHDMVKNFPLLRNPDTLSEGIHFMNRTVRVGHEIPVNVAWEKFKVHLAISLVKKIDCGVEVFGFGTKTNDPQAELALLNELPLLRLFIKNFREKFKKSIEYAHENPVNLISHLGPIFEETNGTKLSEEKRMQFLKAVGLGSLLTLSKRENEVFLLIHEGYSCTQIAEILLLSSRTVEKFICSIKDKLSCDSKGQIIQMANSLFSNGYSTYLKLK